MKIIKIGDIHRILYVSKNFQTGLTDVTGKVISPTGSVTSVAWSGSNPLVGFCELGQGIYYHDWDSAGKAEGVWAFTVDSASKSAKAADTVQLVVEDTLNDTIFEKIDTMIDAVKASVEASASALVTIQQSLVTIDTNVDGVVSSLADGTSGLLAIHDDLAIVDGKVTAIGTLSTGGDGFAAIKSVVDALTTAVSGISNSTKNNWVSVSTVVIPASGSIDRRIFMNVFDGSGNMEDPDSDTIQVEVFSMAGVDLSTTFLAGSAPITMARDGVGQYHIDFTVESTDTVQDLVFKHTYAEGGNTVVREGIVALANSVSGDVSAQLDTIEGKVDTVISATDTVEASLTTIAGYTDSLEGDISAVSGKVDTVDGKVVTAISALTTIKTVVDGIAANGALQTTLGSPVYGSLAQDIAEVRTNVGLITVALSPGGYIV
jgi:hypothetical protein